MGRLGWTQRFLQHFNLMKWDSICYHSQRWARRASQHLRVQTQRPQVKAKATDGAQTVLSHTKARLKGQGYGGKGKGKGGKSLLPKFLLGRDNVGMNAHNRRLCFNYQLNKCSDAADGAECPRGWHLCARRAVGDVMLLIPSKAMTPRRSDNSAASAIFAKLVRLLISARLWRSSLELGE